MARKGDPKESVALLRELVERGFNNRFYAQLHHSKKQGRDDTIAAHIAYCNKTNAFKTSTNPLVQCRLGLIRDEIESTYQPGLQLSSDQLQRLVDKTLELYPL